jgi:hypothetical protein
VEIARASTNSVGSYPVFPYYLFARIYLSRNPIKMIDVNSASNRALGRENRLK